MKEINKIYLIHFLSGLTTIASVTYTLYFLSHGLNQAQIGVLFGTFMIVMAVFNIPTGAIADMFGHRLCVFIGLVFQALSFFFFFAYPSYFGFLLGFLASGLGLAFQTGAITSLIYELLQKENLHMDFQKVYGRANGYFLLGAIIASPIGGFIYKSQPNLPYFMAFLFFSLAAIIAYFIKWGFIKKTTSFKNYFDILNNGVRLTINNNVLLGLILIGVALTVQRMIFNQNIIQPFQIKIGIDVSYIGITAAIISAISALVSFNAYKIYRKFGRNMSLVIIILISSFSALILSFINSLLAIPLLFLLYTGHALRDPVISHITQDEVEGDKRSTMVSTSAFLTAIIAGIMLPVWGKGVDAFGMSNVMFYLGIFTLILGTVGFVVLRSKKS